ncbi:MAG: tetratricopeptide repeat protein [Flavobacteriales bacterium]|nr:tetratricopeptide repeat protein [Flavobacteriales bacterium]
MNIDHTTSICTLAFILFFISACQGPSQKVEEKKETTVESSELPISTTSDEAKKLYEKGLMTFDLGDNQNARTLFDKAIAADPDLAVAYVYRSFCSRSSKEFTDDVKMANEKNKGLSDAEQILVGLDNTYMNNDVTKRMELSKSMVEKYPNVARSHVILGIAYEDMNDHKSARDCFQKAIDTDPNWMGGYNSLANSYIFNEPKDFAAAQTNFQKVVDLMPNESRAHIGLGDAYRAQSDLEKALASYMKAMELSPNDPVAFSKAGHANSFLGNFDDARSNFEKSGSLSEFPAAGLNFTAFTHLYEGDHAEGMSWLKEQAMALNESDLSADRRISTQVNLLENCMRMAYHIGNVAELKSLMEVFEPLDKENSASEAAMTEHAADMKFWHGMIASLEGNSEMANQLAEECKSGVASLNNPNELNEYHFLKGDIAMRAGDHAAAADFFEKADLRGILPKYKAAMAHKAAGNEEKAMQMLQEIADFNFNSIGYALVRKEVKDMLASSS